MMPKTSGYDHVTVLTGTRRHENHEELNVTGLSTTYANASLGGLAYTGYVCSDDSCSLVNAGFESGYRAGYILAHELGHSLNMKHDGDPT
jgi:hypothetical protein